MSWQGFTFSKRVERLATSPIHAAGAKTRELRKKGKDILNLAVAVPDVAIAPELETQIQQAMQAATMEFGAVEGEPATIHAIIQKFKQDNGLTYTPDEVIICNGGKEVLSDAVQVLVNEGDEVILCAPFWPSYLQFILREGGIPVILRPERDDFRITPAQLAAALTPKSKWFILNNPQNPCGVVYTREELAAFADVIAAHPSVAVMADECFETFSYQPTPLTSFAALPGMFDRTFTVNGVGKSYGKPGLRIGYGAGPKALIEQMRVLQSSGPTHANTPGQAATVVMLSELGQAHAPALRQALIAHRDYLVPALASIPGLHVHLPESGYFAFPRVTDLFGKRTPEGQVIRSSADVQMLFLQHEVMTLDGLHCGLDGHIRLAYTLPIQQMEVAVGRLRTAVASLQ